ncbi:MAG: hypothetical protein A2270_04060 [Elusimicrobia bacterium RIFOXYA12_FULL_51_18]|nr:MAG: hypothetical protein A2270_04060 [Elusimicrobia bacterium RIFOXYA12_FULL_51_18]OGS33065.1 MAG: hypothetical protein A2218_04425 [Elusimicrobia bacterium RIFOXYA2_FULL_53_38]
MRKLIIVCALAALACPQARALQDDDLAEVSLSTDTTKADYAPEDEEAQGYIQESEEDLSGFVQDYVKKDTSLKGAFLLDAPASGKILKLVMETAPKKSADGPNNTKVLEAVFKDSVGKKYTVLFHIQSAGFGGIDIFRIALKKETKSGQKDKPKKK